METQAPRCCRSACALCRFQAGSADERHAARLFIAAGRVARMGLDLLAGREEAGDQRRAVPVFINGQHGDGVGLLHDHVFGGQFAERERDYVDAAARAGAYAGHLDVFAGLVLHERLHDVQVGHVLIGQHVFVCH